MHATCEVQSVEFLVVSTHYYFAGSAIHHLPRASDRQRCPCRCRSPCVVSQHEWLRNRCSHLSNDNIPSVCAYCSPYAYWERHGHNCRRRPCRRSTAATRRQRNLPESHGLH